MKAVTEIPTISRGEQGERESKSGKLVDEFIASGAEMAQVEASDLGDRNPKSALSTLRLYLKKHPKGVKADGRTVDGETVIFLSRSADEAEGEVESEELDDSAFERAGV